jgi:hypothetical protein
MAVDPVFSWTYYHRGVSHLQHGKPRQAILDMQEAARRGNHEAQSWLREKGEVGYPRGSRLDFFPSSGRP